MTTFVVSLFTPKTVHFQLPGTPGRGSRSSGKKPEKEKRPPSPKPVGRAPSLFKPLADITPPDSPVNEKPEGDTFKNEDGLRIQFPPPGENSLTPADRGSPTWGARKDQPMSRANSPPPASVLSRNSDVQQKARELGKQGITQPSALTRSDSHDRVFALAKWEIAHADQGNGGLRNAAEAAAREGKLGDHVYVGTLGMPTDALENTQQKRDIEDKLATEHDCLIVWCSDKDFDGHYSHFCKQILWPVFHYQIPDNPKSKAYEDHSWKYYVNVNQAFADKIVKNWKRGDVIWVHDYHLLLVPGMIRKKLPDAKIGFFLHVAFPSSEIFRCLAMRKELLEGMLHANLIGFQIPEYVRHFKQTCSRLLSAEATPDGVQLEDRFVDIISLPIGIDPVALSDYRENKEVKRWLNVMRERYQGKHLIVARDKLDHVRGVRQKLLAYELFLNQNIQWRGKTVLIQVALSTSEKSELDATVSDIVTRVNSSWANLAYQPVVYLKQDIDYAQYLALLTIADALMITSQREGMNLTSHEFLACQDGRDGLEKRHGSLILSEFTGTSSLFGGHELSVNPWDYRACSEAIKKALEMDPEEKERRWTKLYEAVNHHTGAHWFTEFMSRLDRVYEEQHRRDQTSVPRLSMSTLSTQYKKSNRRLFIIDYEGTLVNWGPVDQIVTFSPQVENDLFLESEPASSSDPATAAASGAADEHTDPLMLPPPATSSSTVTMATTAKAGGDTTLPRVARKIRTRFSSMVFTPVRRFVKQTRADITNRLHPRRIRASLQKNQLPMQQLEEQEEDDNSDDDDEDDANPEADFATQQQRTLDVLNDLLVDERNTIYVMSGRRPEELDRLFRRVPNLGLIAENGCFLRDCGSDTWTEVSDRERVRAWKESVKGIMTYFLERTPGATIEERRCSLVFHYKSAEDYESAARSASDCASHINDACEAQMVHAILLDGSVVVEPIEWTKGTAAEKVFEDLKAHSGAFATGGDGEKEGEGGKGGGNGKGPVDFLMVVGDGREDEKVFKWANQLGEEDVVDNVVTVSLGSRNTEATATLTQGVSGVLLTLQRLAALS